MIISIQIYNYMQIKNIYLNLRILLFIHPLRENMKKKERTGMKVFLPQITFLYNLLKIATKVI